MHSPYITHVQTLQNQTDQTDIEMTFDPKWSQDELRQELYTRRGPVDVEELRELAREMIAELESAYDSGDIPLIETLRREMAEEMFIDPTLELLIYEELDL